MDVSLTRIAELVGGDASGDLNKNIQGVAPFEGAGPDEVTYAGNAKYLKRINETSAGAIIVPHGFTDDSRNLIFVDIPYVAFATILKYFNPPVPPDSGISSSAYIGKNFVCGRDVSIAPMVMVADNVSLGNGVIVHPGVVIEEGVVVGDNVEICPNVSILKHSRIGNRVRINAGTVIGSDGFGFAPDGEKYHKIIHTGIVQIDDDVEIGACNTIDRATFGKTWIKQGVKTDNIVHIAHNVTVGENTVIVAQSGIAGSTSIGNQCILAGQSAISGHLTIGNNVTIGPKAGVAKSHSDGEVVSGSPEMPHKIWLRVNRLIPRLPELFKKFSRLEKRVDEIDGKENESGE